MDGILVFSRGIYLYQCKMVSCLVWKPLSLNREYENDVHYYQYSLRAY